MPVVVQVVLAGTLGAVVGLPAQEVRGAVVGLPAVTALQVLLVLRVVLDTIILVLDTIILMLDTIILLTL